MTRNGKPFAILTGTSPTKLDEDLRKLRRRQFGKALAALKEEAKAKGLDKLTLEEINAVISEVRQERRRRESGV